MRLCMPPASFSSVRATVRLAFNTRASRTNPPSLLTLTRVQTSRRPDGRVRRNGTDGWTMMRDDRIPMMMGVILAAAFMLVAFGTPMTAL
jgi:hypothetical protein